MNRLSVIVPGYRTAEAWWARCLASVVRAIDATDEIVCVDDGSPDGILFLDEGLRRDTRLRVIHRRNGGLSVARNTAMTVCRGKWVTFVDSDDEVTDSVYRKTLAACERYHADIGLFGVRTVWVDEGLYKEDVPARRDVGPLTPMEVRELSRLCLLNYAWNKVYSKTFLREHRLFFAEKGMPCEDIVFNLGCIMAGARWCSVDCLGYVYYRTGMTLLSCYRPFNGNGLRLCRDAWRRYIAQDPCAVSLLGAYVEADDERLVWAEWDNIWRIRSPYSVRGKLRFLRDHAERMAREGGDWQGRLLRLSPILLLLVRSLYQVFRRRFYVRPLRRWHIRRLYPQVRPWHGLKG